MSNRNPESYIITQVSNSLDGSNSLVPLSSNQTSNVYASYGVPNSENNGNMTLIGHGNPSTETNLDLRIQKSGTIENAATYIWKETTESNSDWRGDNDQRFMYDFDAPYCTSSTVPQQDCFGATACFADFLKLELLYYVKNQTEVRCAFRTINGVNDEASSWTVRDCSVSSTLVTGRYANVDVAVTIKDTILMAIVANNDIQILQSTDGFTWQIICQDVLKRFSNIEEYSAFNISDMKLAVSGDYARIIFAVDNTAEEYLYVLASSDLGLSWKRTNEDSIRVYAAPQYSDYKYSFDICAVQDSDGSFMITVPFATESFITLPNVSGPIYEVAETRTYIGFATQDFSELDENRIYHQRVALDHTEFWAKTFRVQAGKVFLFKTDSHIYLIDTGKVPFNYPNEEYFSLNMPPSTTYASLQKQEMKFSFELRMWRMPLDGIITSSRWESLNDEILNSQGTFNTYRSITNRIGITGFCNGTGRIWFGRSKFYFLGNAVACFSTMVDTENKAVNAGRHAYFKLGGWNKKPANDTFPDGYSLTVLPNYAGRNQPHGKLFDLQWNAIFGSPNSPQYGLPNTVWTLTDSGGGFSTLYPNYLQMICIGTGTIRFTCTIDECNDPETAIWGGGRTVLGGSCLRFIAGNITVGANPDVRITSQTEGLTDDVRVTIGMQATKLTFRDQLGSVVDAIVPDTSVYGSDPFTTSLWEVRLVFEADSRFVQVAGFCRVFCRKIGSEDWLESSLMTFTTGSSTTVNTSGSTSIYFEQTSSGTNHQSHWQCLEFRKNNSLGMLTNKGTATTYTDIRGRPCNTVGTTLLKNYLQASFGGGSAAYSDTYTLKTQFSYDINNVVGGSSILNWRSNDDLTSSSIVFESANGSFIHNGWGIFGLNCKTVQVDYSDDSTFTTGVNTIATKDLSTGILCRVDTVFGDNSTVGVSITDYKSYQDSSFNGFSSTDKFNVYARFTSLSGATTGINLDASMKIIDHFDNKFVLDVGDTPVYSGAVGSTITIYSDRISFKESSSDDTVKKYCKVTMTGDTSEGYHTLGSFIAGQVINFEVPMDWSFTDTETANIEDNRSRSGVRWNYPEGPPTRTISGRIIGDVTQYQRSKMRTALRKSQYATTPLCLVLTDEGLTNPNNVVLSRYVNEFTMDNAAWYYDSASQSWYVVGDTSITFEEEA